MNLEPIPGVDAPLLGTFSKLEDLFDGIELECVWYDHNCEDTSWGYNHYRPEPGYFPLAGLPGAVQELEAIFVRPRQFVAEAVEDKCQNGVIGGFKAIRSAHWLKQGLLPVYAFDYHRFVSVFIALVDASEHDRFNPGGK